MNKRLLVLSIILVIAILFLIKSNILNVVYVVPQTNTDVLPYISKSLKEINQKLNSTMALCNKYNQKMEFLYKNAYGSGFIDNNPIPNDLDFSVGINLGDYKYDGTNSKEIARDLESKISNFVEIFYAISNSSKNKDTLTDKNVFEVFGQYSNKKTESIKNISEGIDKYFNNQDRVIHVTKIVENKNIKYTLILENNEILVNDFSPIYLFSKKVKYNKKMSEYAREITIIPDFFVNIENTKTKEVKTLELIEESYLGQRFQLSRRFFVPIIFLDNTSAKYLKSLDYLNDDKKYVETRLFNYKRHLYEISNLLEISISPVKILKRMQQSTDLIAPMLSQKDKEKIYTDIKKVMENSDVQLANEYANSIKVLTSLTQSEYLFKKSIETGNLNDVVQTSNIALDKLKVSGKYVKELKELIPIQAMILDKMTSVNNQKTLEEFSTLLKDKYVPINICITKIVNKNIENKYELFKDTNILENVLLNSGFHKIGIYWIDEKTIAIAKNEYTKNLTKKDLVKIAQENNLQKADYILIDKEKVKQSFIEIPTYIRFNPTKEEDLNYKTLQEVLLKDKKNFNIKQKFVF